MVPSRPLPLLVALALSLPLSAADAAKAKPITLKPGPLAYDCQALVPAAIAANSHGSSHFSVINHTGSGSALHSAHLVRFKGETSLTIAGTTFVIAGSADDDRMTIAAGKSRVMGLKQKGAGYEGVPVPVGKRQLILAFPDGGVSSRGAWIWWMNGGANRGAWDGAELSLYDEDCDGAFRAGTDLVSVGSGVVFVPIGERLAGPKGLFRITELNEDGTRLTLAPDDAPAGKLTVKGVFAGGEAHLALDAAGIDAVAVQGKAIAAPVGSIQLKHGLVMNPARKAPAALIVAGTFKAVEVAADQGATLAVGGPFSVGFTPRTDGGKLKIASELVISGLGGETYHNFKWVGPPQVLINGKGIGAFGFG
jgi:hypothetical protein